MGSINLLKQSRYKTKIPVERIYALYEYRKLGAFFYRSFQDSPRYCRYCCIEVRDVKECIHAVDRSNRIELQAIPAKDRITCVPVDNNHNYTGQTGNVTGFGRNRIEYLENPSTGKTRLKKTSDFKLRFVESKIISNYACSIYYKTIQDSHICSQVKQQSASTYEGLCEGDSGGPFVYKGTVIGIVSRAPSRCGEESLSAIYTRVTSFLDFIRNAIKDHIIPSMRFVIWHEHGSYIDKTLMTDQSTILIPTNTFLVKPNADLIP